MTTFKDRVRETTDTIGLGEYDLNGAVAAHVDFFTAFGAVSDVCYCVEDGVNYEVGRGTILSGTPVKLQRDTIEASSNGNAEVDWGVGTKRVFHVLPASVAALIGVSSFNLDDLADVNAPSPADNEVLGWDNGAGEWTPRAPGTGPSGADGRNAGIKYTFDSSTSSADPGTGEFRFNNGTLASVTALYISETDGDGNGIAPLLAALDDSTSSVKAVIIIRNDADPSDVWIGQITATLTDNGAWDTFTVNHIASNGSFTNGDVCKLEFSLVGTKGDTGSSGSAGGVAGSLVAGYTSRHESDTLATITSGLTNGADAAQWDDLSGNARHLTEATNKPVGRSADDDGLPYLEFTAANSDVLEATRGSLYTGTDFTFFVVVRNPIQSATATVIGFSESGENMASGVRPFVQVASSASKPTFNDGRGDSYGHNADLVLSTAWTVHAFRCDVRLGRATAMYVAYGQTIIRDLGGTTLTAYDFDRWRIGSRYANFGATGDFFTGYYRAVVMYESALTDYEFAQVITYLRDKYKADVLRY